QAQLKLFVVVDVARHVHADEADDDDAGAVARQLARQPLGLARIRTGGEQHAVRAVAAGQPQTRGARRHIAGGDGVGARLVRQLASRRVNINADHLAAGGFQDLHSELAHQSEADDGGDFAQARVGLADALQRDGADGRVAGGFERRRVGHPGAEVLRAEDDFGVRGVPGAGAGDAVADLKLPHVAPDADHQAGGAVAERLHLVELRHDLLVSRTQAFALERIEHLTDEVRAFLDLADQRALRRLDGRAFGAGADQRIGGAHQNAARSERRRRQLLDFQFTGAVILDDLFHEQWSVASGQWPVFSDQLRVVRDNRRDGN